MNLLFAIALFAVGQPAEEIRAATVTVAKPAARSPIDKYKRIAMMPLSSLGSTNETVDAIQRVLIAEFQEILDKRLITPDQLLDIQEEAKGGFYTCGGVVVCLIEVAGGMGWDAFIVGNIAGLGERRAINLKLIDVRTGGEVRQTSERASGAESELIIFMRKAAVQLVAPSRFTGTLTLATKQTGIQIVVDGKIIGTTPLKSNQITLIAGRHAIEAKGEGLVPFSTMAEIAYREDKTVTINLPRSTAFVGGDTPFRYRWWTWAIAGAGAIGVGLGGYFNYLHVDAVDKIERRAKRGRLDVDSANLYDDQEDHWNRAVIFYGAGGVLAGGAGVLLAVDFM